MLVARPSSCFRFQRTKVNLPLHTRAIPFNAKIVRKTIERMIQRMHYISQPKCFSPQSNYVFDNIYYIADDDDNDVSSNIALFCIITILFLYGIVVLLKQYENKHEE